MYQFFVEPQQIHVADKSVTITGNDVNHIKNVLRMKIGEEIAVSNGQDGKEYRCGIREYTEDAVLCELRFIKEDGVELPSRIYLFQGLPKADKMELIIQKAVELGVSQIVPVAMKRSVVKLDDKKAAAKLPRWNAISESAAKQSKRSLIPEVRPVMSYALAVREAAGCDICFVPYENENGMAETRRLVSSITPGNRVAVFIGPEGGFEDDEIEAARKLGMHTITLGKRILRTETAGLSLLSMLAYALEN